MHLHHLVEAPNAGRSDAQAYHQAIERCTETLRVPLGRCAPLLVDGEHAQGSFVLPVATTEAALLASLSRGARVISEAGGCRTAVAEDHMRRAPAFVFGGVHDAMRFARWVGQELEALRRVAAGTTRHGRLLSVTPIVEGNHVYLDLCFTTGEAAGQNMVTFAADAVCTAIVARSPVAPTQVLIESNLSGDKKPTQRSMNDGRGKRAVAEVRLPAELVHRRLSVSAAEMADCWRINAVGAAMSGAFGFQGHYANALAGLYLATGQDVACVAESATGITRMQLDGGAFYASVTLPNVVVGTVGGGTVLPDQRRELQKLGLTGTGSSRALAELCAALCLAGEISLCAAIAGGQFGRAHRCLARKRRPDSCKQAV